MKPYAIQGAVFSDATGQQDAIVKMQGQACMPFCRVTGVKCTADVNDEMYKAYMNEIQQNRLFYLEDPPVEMWRAMGTYSQEHVDSWYHCRDQFIEQNTDVERKIIANRVKLQAPDRKGAHDDYIVSGALALHAITSGPDLGAFKKDAFRRHPGVSHRGRVYEA
jgi:hypothetical protein